MQVSSKAAANGPVYITVETGQPTALYDLPSQASDFGTIKEGLQTLNYGIDCQSIDDATETCSAFSNYLDYNKSTWHVFKTPAYFDFIILFLCDANMNSTKKFGIKIYQGDVRSTPYPLLPVVGSCDSLQTSGQTCAYKSFRCEDLNPNTTYSIEIFYNKDYAESSVKLSMLLGGIAPTIAPEPILSAITPTTNNMGVLPSSISGITTGRSDYLGCNSRHTIHPCNPSLLASGVLYNGNTYNLSTFFTFTTATTSNLTITARNSGYYCNQPLLVRLYNQNVSNSCSSLDTANIIKPFLNSNLFTCFPPGTYTLQILGQDKSDFSYYTYGNMINGFGAGYCSFSNLGNMIDLNINVKSVNASNKYSLSSSGIIDTINRVGGAMQPLVPGTKYLSNVDTFGCANTVLPLDADCVTGNTKAIYREFVVADSGIVSLWSSSIDLHYKLYKGDADALATAQNIFNYPSKINGLTPQTICLANNGNYCDGAKVCLLPGTYTDVVFGNENSIGITNQIQTKFDVVNTVHNSLANAEDLGDILSVIPINGGSITSSPDFYSCKDNAIIIDGFQPCKGGYGSPGTKAIYRQFYLSSPATVTINSIPVGCDYTPVTLFKGKAMDGVSALTVMPAPWRCFTSVGLNNCDVLPAGWYTIVSYGWGPSYQNPTRDINDVYYNYVQYGSMIGYGNKVKISVSVSPCAAPKYNRPYKAAIDTITHKPFLIEWGPGVGHTSAYPKTDKSYTLYPENFNCNNDTPFISHPIKDCNPGLTKVAYWVFQTTQESFVRINTNNYWGAVYAGDVRKDSILFGSVQPIQPCLQSEGQIQLCKLQPGYYTLAIFAPPSLSCNSVTPTIYIDAVGYSRFDHANNAYDFGLIPPDSIYHNGKTGDINPLDAGRAPSNDFFYCTTGAQPTDPVYGCYSDYFLSIYTAGPNTALYSAGGALDYYGSRTQARRNLWYTFTVDKGGWVRVKVKNMTIGKGYQYPYFVAKSDVNGTLPFTTVVSSGQVDSTVAQGLNVFTGNAVSGNICSGGAEVSFYRDPCSAIAERYYIIVQNRNPADPNNNLDWSPFLMVPNHQVEVSVLFDSINAITPKFDHYYQASNIGTNLGPGTYKGETDNFTCATRDATEPSWSPTYEANSCTKTLWYKFSTTVSGVVKPALFLNGQLYSSHPYAGILQLYRQIIPGDSTYNGLQPMDFYNAAGEVCITPGTYYIRLPNCEMPDGSAYPQIELIENAGDYCSKPVSALLNGPGNVVASAIINCHTIGTDYGEFNPTLTCPNGALTANYKSTWFRIDIGGADTLDVTTYINENTSVTPTQIKYRLMNGTCGAMQERSCVQDALTKDTYKCLPPGSYWIQVFSPVNATGSIDLNVSAVKHTDTCAPINNCLVNANFQKQFDCTKSNSVQFINYSTFGSSISYVWNFGYNGQTSTAVSPSFAYPALATPQKYYITLTVTNNDCKGVVFYTDSITIPPMPRVNLGADTILCNGGPLLLNATSHPGAVYQWSTGATTPTLLVNTSGQGTYSVIVTYNNCMAKDTIKVFISPIKPVKAYNYFCSGNAVVLNGARSLGETHLWSNGSTATSISVSAPGIYWNEMSLNGCVTRDTFIVSSVAYPLGNDRSVCFNAQPYVLNATTQGANGYAWQNGSTNATFSATSAGVYWVDISFGNCVFRDSIVLGTIQAIRNNQNITICQGQNYTLLSGIVVSTSGIYADTLRTTQGCDSVINTVSIAVKNINSINISATVCGGQTYTLPWGTVVNSTGVYADTLRYINSGCDSVRKTVSLTVQNATSTVSKVFICQGENYTLPWGKVVNVSGLYEDTIRYANTYCDSLRESVVVTVQPVQDFPIVNDTICSGQTYTLPWGKVVNVSGVHGDTLRYENGTCDSVRRQVKLVVQNLSTQIINEAICSGKPYVLPWGVAVTIPGTYSDTLHYNSGCDSLYRIVNITAQSTPSSVINGAICQGQLYTLPWGAVVSNAGTYKDTMHYSGSGCDSVYLTVNLSYQSVQIIPTIDTTICVGQNYTLPWGTVVNASGTYNDTLRYKLGGCDSVIRSVNLIINTSRTITTNEAICSGGSYILPWGQVVNVSGTYRDTLHYVGGCDSLYRIINLTAQPAPTKVVNATICNGQTYALPWGSVVNLPGVYKDTMHYSLSGCDSVYITVNLTVNPILFSSINANICAGQTYTLPWGKVVNSSGIYSDTIRYSNGGCDSLRRTVDLTVQTVIASVINATLCSGQNYTLPWGNVVAASGIYKDTLRSGFGCDSVYRTVNLSFNNAINASVVNAVVCAGQTYTLPWGKVVSTSGIYRDTVKYKNSICDSLVRTINLTALSVITQSINATLCSGQNYTLPWGTVVNASGIYKDTIKYPSGCDSLRRIVNLTILTVKTIANNVTICQGKSYTLPWGAVVVNAGIYKDTLHYAVTHCDSLYRIVNLTVTPSAFRNISASICAGDTYKLPWGALANLSGVYNDTLKTAFGCDSIVTSVQLVVLAKPSVLLTKSNDINCVIGITNLNATGGINYLWSPPESLSNPRAKNPTATPDSTTVYNVLVTGINGCVTKESIQVNVDKTGIDNGYLLPNAFTPNNDGKNDCFGVEKWGRVANLKFEIYNQYGQLIFSTTNPLQCWDGTFKGVNLQTGTFVYQISAETICGKVYRKGTITLIR